MESSFSLKCNFKDSGTVKRVNNKLSNVFSQDEDEPKVVKTRIFELSEGQTSGSKTEIQSKLVIPCKNTLSDLKEDRALNDIKINAEDLKFGLNILKPIRTSKKDNQGNIALSHTKSTVDRSTPPENPHLSLTRVSGGGDIGFSYTATDSVSEQKSQANTSEAKGESNERVTDKNNLVSQAEPSSLTSDSEIAKLIMDDVSRAKLNEELFGISDDSVMRTSKTAPILLRGEKGKEEGDMRLKQYDKVPVEEFGLAMLLGMGYDPEKNTVEPKVYKRRVYERAGLGTDSVMKGNMESLMDVNLMSKLKKDHMFNEGGTLNWLTPGLLVKVIDKNHPKYRQKGIVVESKGNAGIISIDSKKHSINFKHLETVVRKDAKHCKVVGKIANNAEKCFIPFGTTVKILEVAQSHAKVLFKNTTFNASLDAICEFA